MVTLLLYNEQLHILQPLLFEVFYDRLVSDTADDNDTMETVKDTIDTGDDTLYDTLERY